MKEEMVETQQSGKGEETRDPVQSEERPIGGELQLEGKCKVQTKTLAKEKPT